MANATTTSITLHYVCEDSDCSEADAGTVQDQQLVDVPEVGTLICQECGEDLVLQEEVTVELDGLKFSMKELNQILGKD